MPEQSAQSPAAYLAAYEEEEEQDRDISTTNSATGTSGTSIEEHSVNIEKSAKRTYFVAILVVMLGAAASSAFLYLGITNSKSDEEELFERRAVDLAKEIDSAWRDYEVAALWIHESCRNWREENYTHDDFRVLYDYIKSSGLDFEAAEFIPRVEHADREKLEAEAYQYFADHPEMNHTYSGFMGQEPSPDDPNELSYQNRSVQPFYYLLQFAEPFVPGVYHYDLYSPPWEQPTIQTAIDTWKPALTGRFLLLSDDERSGYSVVLYHPGIPLSENLAEGEDKPRDLSNLVINLESLLIRATRFQSESLGAFLYDVTLEEGGGAPAEFLTGLEVLVQKEDERDFNVYQETSYEELMSTDPYLSYEEVIRIGGKLWKIVVVPVDDSYEPSLTFIIFSGTMIFVASLMLAIWMVHNMKRSIQLHRVITKAAAEAAIVSNLFPESVLKRMLADAAAKNNKVGVSRKQDVFSGKSDELNKAKLNDYLTSEGIFGSTPIAELHPYVTIMFADLVGFTAWSSVREPSQVFSLLELLWNSFDNIAKRRRVFKVETVGDCYVAVAGLPKPREDHAAVMARFATDCLNRCLRLVKALETTLGPDTGDLGLRVGLHSGQVTGGVLRGDKGRFQLFGDTMNMTSRMESTGVKNKIQVSQETADLLFSAGRDKWLVPRDEAVNVKGKGSVRTFFLSIKQGSKTSAESLSDASEASNFAESTNKARLHVSKLDKTQRLVDWNVQVLSNMLRKIVARRQASRKESAKIDISEASHGRMVLDEVKEVIPLPKFDKQAFQKQVDPASIELEPVVEKQLTKLMTEIASLYHDNPFHNYEHACHVTMSVIKMMSRIIDPQEGNSRKKKKECDLDDRALHERSLGIQSDPLTQFACCFSAIIHDLDHTGVPNTVLVKEENPLAHKYNNKSVAEQNSVDLAWNLLMGSEYEELRNCICCNSEEFSRFRSLVVNSVMATDIMDKELGAARKARWNKAFDEEREGAIGKPRDESSQVAFNRKATIVIEHLIQASDVSHTMQHWHIYIKWNERLFMEMYKAYKEGRLDVDPSVGWHQGEMGFFDFYIIPLAKKLFKCGVFGVSSDEYLNYALINRREWERKGVQMVSGYIKKYEDEMNAKKEEDEAKLEQSA